MLKNLVITEEQAKIFSPGWIPGKGYVSFTQNKCKYCGNEILKHSNVQIKVGRKFAHRLCAKNEIDILTNQLNKIIQK